jgi:hypothetical protein
VWIVGGLSYGLSTLVEHNTIVNKPIDDHRFHTRHEGPRRAP